MRANNLYSLCIVCAAAIFTKKAQNYQGEFVIHTIIVEIASTTQLCTLASSPVPLFPAKRARLPTREKEGLGTRLLCTCNLISQLNVHHPGGDLLRIQVNPLF